MLDSAEIYFNELSNIINRDVTSAPHSVKHEEKKKPADSTDPLILALLTLVTTVNLLKDSAITDSKRLTNSEQNNVQSLNSVQTALASQPKLEVKQVEETKPMSFWDRIAEDISNVLPGASGSLLNQILTMGVEGIVLMAVGAGVCTGLGAIAGAVGGAIAAAAAASAAVAEGAAVVAEGAAVVAEGAAVVGEGAAAVADVAAQGAAIAEESSINTALAMGRAALTTARTLLQPIAPYMNVLKTGMQFLGAGGVAQQTFGRISDNETIKITNEADWQKQLAEQQQCSLNTAVIQQQLSNTTQYQETLGNGLEDKLAKATNDIDTCMSLLSSIGSTGRMITTRV